MERRKGSIAWKCILSLGVACILSAGSLAAYNIYDADRAGKAAWAALADVDRAIIAAREETAEVKKTEGITPVPDYVIDPGTRMPQIDIEGRPYIGRIDIPELGISLPVGARLSDEMLQYSPCRYYGSIYEGKCMIGGHDYLTHFGPITSAKNGMLVSFSDVEGNELEYEVVDINIVDGHDFQAAFDGEWDLTLFTCTIGGSDRVMVRCQKV